MDQPRVLVVEDEPVARMMLEVRLRAVGYAVVSTPSAEAALPLLYAERFALLITDLHLDCMDGIALMAQARALDAEIELIVVTGGATLDSVIAAIEHRIHAYLRKPVAAGELEQRVAVALARRRCRMERATAMRQLSATLKYLGEPEAPLSSVAAAPGVSQQIGILTLDTRKRKVAIAGRSVLLSRGEFELLLCLAQHAEQVVSPEQLVREMFSFSCSLDEARKLLKPHIYRLRRKIEPNPQAPTLLLSVRGAGYMITAGD